MGSASLRHGLIASRVFAELAGRLDGERFDVTCGHAKVIANGHVHVPDLVVFPPPPCLDGDTVPHPVLVVEVVSSATRLADNFDKNVDYAETPSIQHYLMLSDERPAALLCSRTPAGWVSSDVDGTADGGGTIDLPAIGLQLRLASLYRRIEFDGD